MNFIKELWRDVKESPSGREFSLIIRVPLFVIVFALSIVITCIAAPYALLLIACHNAARRISSLNGGLFSIVARWYDSIVFKGIK